MKQFFYTISFCFGKKELPQKCKKRRPAVWQGTLFRYFAVYSLYRASATGEVAQPSTSHLYVGVLVSHWLYPAYDTAFNTFAVRPEEHNRENK
jgi:hypothetical protein